MLTRLKVSGFKNLVDVDVQFGPFTCIAGPNAVGKSNLFDAIRFLSFLANDTLMNAALSIRAEGGRTADIRSLFHQSGNEYARKMSFETEMILPEVGKDDLGQKAIATITFVRYTLELGYRTDSALPTSASLELLREELEHINLGEAPRLLVFPHKVQSWRKSVLKGRRTSPFLSTVTEGGNRIIKLSQDGSGGRPRSILATNLPRTVLSTVNAIESPTALLARREMQSWRLLQLEPGALREPDSFSTPPGLGTDGSHLPATLYYLAHPYGANNHSPHTAPVYGQITSRLADLIDDISDVQVDRDQKRELFTLYVQQRDGTTYPARSLSDGTLRFLALAVLDLDPSASGLICLEEPENGIHPERIPAMLQLLQDIACDVDEAVGDDNPLRQVIINTHSPSVVNQVPDDSLLVAQIKETFSNNKRKKGVRFSWLPETWRTKADPDTPPIDRGHLLAYLNPILLEARGDAKKVRRVVDRDDIQMIFPLFQNQNE
ncbi:MAG: AAA family ATPase [Anaerolineales bacterium]|nr:AAA family ATPase [Anaerolineales bacterium]MCB8954130.1 AAA family ATPase [Ardenticatenales bacterium]